MNLPDLPSGVASALIKISALVNHLGISALVDLAQPDGLDYVLDEAKKVHKGKVGGPDLIRGLLEPLGDEVLWDLIASLSDHRLAGSIRAAFGART